MSSSDERREVAARLRNEGRALDAIDATTEIASLTLDDALGIDHMSGWCDVFNRLANLIDPTCRVVIPNEMDGECFCSECGALLGEYGYTAYCPSCGARCVDNGGGHAGDD